MVVENGVIGGYAFISAMFAYLAFKLRETDSIFNQVTSLLFFSLSLLFVNMVMYSLYLVVQNTTGISYLNNSLMSTALLVILWVTVFVLVMFILITLFEFLKMIYEIVSEMLKQKRIL